MPGKHSGRGLHVDLACSIDLLISLLWTYRDLLWNLYHAYLINSHFAIQEKPTQRDIVHNR